MTNFRIRITGLDKLRKSFAQFPDTIRRNMWAAGREAVTTIIFWTTGIQRYPSATAANAPPHPYYIRGRGTQVSAGRNLYNSERLGTQFYVSQTLGSVSGFTTEAGNRASYAPYVIGDDQASFMKPKGWRKLSEVAREKIGDIRQVLQAWVDKTIRDLDL